METPLFDLPEILRVVPWNVFRFNVIVVAVGAIPLFTVTAPEVETLLPAAVSYTHLTLPTTSRV